MANIVSLADVKAEIAELRVEIAAVVGQLNAPAGLDVEACTTLRKREERLGREMEKLRSMQLLLMQQQLPPQRQQPPPSGAGP